MTEKEESQKTFTVNDRRGQPKEEDKVPSEPELQAKAKNFKSPSGPIDFSTFVLSMSSSALVHMGLVEDPHTKKMQKNLGFARQNIDILEMLNEKTKGNLNPEEKRMMEEVLYELRLRFVEAAKQ